MGIINKLTNTSLSLRDRVGDNHIDNIEEAINKFNHILVRLKEVRDKKNGMNYKTIDNEDLDHLIKLIEE